MVVVVEEEVAGGDRVCVGRTHEGEVLAVARATWWQP